MRALSATLVIVISAVVILVAALVVLTIFGQGTAPLATLAEARNFCRVQATPICESIGQMPFTWKVPSVNYENKIQSCDEIFNGNCRCAEAAGAGNEGKQWELVGCNI
jgi:hypothetical protein